MGPSCFPCLTCGGTTSSYFVCRKGCKNNCFGGKLNLSLSGCGVHKPKVVHNNLKELGFYVLWGILDSMFLLHSIPITLAATSEHAPFNQSHCPLFLDSYSFLLVQDNNCRWSLAVESSCKIQGSAKTSRCLLWPHFAYVEDNKAKSMS
jgi:hypothetical protein